MKRTGKAGHIGAILSVLPGAVVLLPDPDHVVLERHLTLPKIANADEAGAGGPTRTTPPARNPEVAVQEEYQMARQRGTVQALELFIARHPDSPLAEKARADLSAMKR